MSTSPCDTCIYYSYDEDYDCYICSMDLDEDEMCRFIENRCATCPYYQLDDEYKIVRKQN